MTPPGFRSVPRAAAITAAVLVTTTLGTPTLAGAAEWRVEAALGVVWNAPIPLTIRQTGAPDLRARPRWSTRPFESPPYYVVRVARGDWAVELVHHKLYLRDPPPGVQDFSISHGYNLVVLSRRWGGDRSGRSLGAGVVIAHPENTVRDRPLRVRARGGYVLAGGAMSAGVWHDVGSGRWRGLGELATTAAWARVPVDGGSADVPNVALHGRFGGAYRFR